MTYKEIAPPHGNGRSHPSTGFGFVEDLSVKRLDQVTESPRR